MENGTKARILYLYQHLLRHTDADNPVSTAELKKMLQEQHNITANRNTISNDLQMLYECDKRIEVLRSSQNWYYYDHSEYDIPEMKLLIDAVSSSKFITERESEKLIEKILSHVSRGTAEKLRRHVYASDRVKSDNERGYYIVDAVNEAIDREKKIRFYYTDFDLNKKRYVTNEGKPYTVSPYALIWDGDYYYLRGFCDEREAMRTFRLDRIAATPEILAKDAVPKPADFSIAEFSKSVFRMYDADQSVDITLHCHASNMKVLIDHFGMDFETTPVDKETFTAKIRVCPSPTFYRWIFGFGGKIKILGPERVAEEYRKMVFAALR